MKRTLLFICTILCANVIFAQEFWEGGLVYYITGAGEVEVGGCYNSTTSVNIPSTVTHAWTHREWSSDSEDYITITDSVRTYSVTSIGYNAFLWSDLTSVTIPNSVTSIGNGAFFSCNDLTSINIPNSVTYIGGAAFGGCSSLTSITIPNSVTSIGEQTFSDCSSLTSIDIPDSVTSIGNGAFENCSSLTSITIPNSVTSIGGGVFYNCSSLTSVTLSNNITELPSYDYDYYNEYYNNGFFENCSSLTSVTIPNSVTSIGKNAFRFCDSLTSVTIPNSVNSIGEGAFEYCSSLTSVTIPNSVTSIGESAFRGCSSLTSVTIPNSVIAIYSEAFRGCSSLTSVTIPNSVTFIGWSAFEDCSSLTSVTIPNSVTIIGYYAFGGCSSLTTLNYNAINCPNFYNYDDDDDYEYYYYQFAYCPITTINIGDSVQIIPNYFAYNLDSLTSVTIPNSVDTIGSSAFYNCSSLTSITCLADIPPALGNNVFNNTPSNKILYVNCGLKDDYISSWGDYFNSNNIQEITFDINTYVNNESGGSVAIERNNCSTATLTATANICYQFVSWNDGNTENPRIVTLSSDTSFTAIFDSILFDTIINATINAGETYTEFGFDVNEEGTYTRILITEDGCDSIVTLSLNIIPVFNTELSATICQGQTYTENGFNVSEAGVYTQILTAVNGFDSIVTLSLNVLPIFNTELSATICQGQVYTENGFNVSEAGVYTQTLTSANGCDSIVTLSLNVNPTFNTELSATICQGQVYNENGFNVSEAGVYTQTLTSANGCDSIVTLSLNVNPTFNTELSATICQGQVYNENGFNVSEAGVYTQTLTSVNGCDSIVTLSLNVNPIFNTELSATICQGQVYTENGFNVSEAGVYTQTLTSVNGCDSIVTLTLNVNPTFNTELSATICQGQVYNENGFNVSEAGVYTQTLTSVNGCDSIVTLSLNVNPIFNTELSATICQGQVYTENGFNVSEAGVYTQTLTSVNGCDSIVTLTLNVNPTFNTELSATICQGQVYNENGFNVSEAGVYTQTLTSVNGCDSIVTLSLNVNPTFNTELSATICQGQVYTENGFNVSEAGVYTQTLTSANGCDSIVTLSLNVNPTFNTELSANICQGQVYTENGFNVSEAGVYTQTLTSVNGCDSIVTLTLNVNPTFNTELSANICQGQVYNENGFNVSEAGVYTQTLTSVNGCDSIVTLTLNVNPTFDTTINATINAGETYAEFGFSESEAGTYVQNLQTEAGCDSTITLVLSVNSSLIDIEETEITFYPNPTDSKITFSQKIEKVEVIDLTGKTIFTFSNAKTINIESLPSGAYYLRLTNEEKTTMKKVIKQ